MANKSELCKMALNKTFLLFSLFAAFICIQTTEILQDYRLSAFSDEPKECTAAGVCCETCHSRVICVETNHTWDKTPLDTCDAPLKCVNGQCTSDYDPVCDDAVNLEFPCQTHGMFPDPWDCRKYVMCIEEKENDFKAYSYQCEAGFGFNIANDLCDEKLRDDKCKETYPVPECKNISDHGAMRAKPAMYYICEEYSDEHQVLYPKLNLCREGGTFQDFKCVLH